MMCCRVKLLLGTATSIDRDTWSFLHHKWKKNQPLERQTDVDWGPLWGQQLL